MPAGSASSHRSIPARFGIALCLPQHKIAGVGFVVFIYVHPRAGTNVDAVVTVEASQVDIVTIEGLRFGPPAVSRVTGTHPASTAIAGWRARLTSNFVIGAAAGVGLAMLLLVASIFWRRRASRRNSLAASEAQS